MNSKIENFNANNEPKEGENSPDKDNSRERNEEALIIIKRSSEASGEVKQNPFYDPEIWGRADSADEIYLPDSDEAISFAMAAHEIGHLVKEGARDDARLDNFEAGYVEEQRAWDKGWPYLEKYLAEYYKDSPEIIFKIQQAFENIKNLMMQAVALSKDMYLEKGSLDNLRDKEIREILKQRRQEFFQQKGEEIVKIFAKIKKQKIGVKPDWDKFTVVVKKAVQDILKDNSKTA